VHRQTHTHTHLHTRTHLHTYTHRHTHAEIRFQLGCKIISAMLKYVYLFSETSSVSHTLPAFCLSPLATSVARKLLSLSLSITRVTAARTDSLQPPRCLSGSLSPYIPSLLKETVVGMLCNPHGNLPVSSLETAVPPWLIRLVPVGSGPLSYVSVLSQSANRSC